MVGRQFSGRTVAIIVEVSIASGEETGLALARIRVGLSRVVCLVLKVMKLRRWKLLDTRI